MNVNELCNQHTSLTQGFLVPCHEKWYADRLDPSICPQDNEDIVSFNYSNNKKIERLFYHDLVFGFYFSIFFLWGSICCYVNWDSALLKLVAYPGPKIGILPACRRVPQSCLGHRGCCVERLRTAGGQPGSLFLLAVNLGSMNKY